MADSPAAAARAVDRPSDFTFLTPGDWFRIRLEEPELSADVDRLVGELLARHPERDSVAPQVRAMIEARTRSAGQEDGALELHLSFTRLSTEQGDLPLAAALLVHLAPFPSAVTTRELLTSFASRGKGEGSIVNHDSGPTARREWRSRTALDERTEAETLVVQRLFPAPDASAYVLLSLSTPLVAIADPMRELFDAMCDSFRWIGGPPA